MLLRVAGQARLEWQALPKFVFGCFGFLTLMALCAGVEVVDTGRRLRWLTMDVEDSV